MRVLLILVSWLLFLTSPILGLETKISGILLGTPPAGIQQVLDALNVKLKSDLGVVLELSYIGWNEVNSKYPLVLASGEGVDWIYTASWAPYTSQAVRGAFQPLTPALLQTWMPQHWAVTPAIAWEQAKVGGKLFMIPTASPDRKVPIAVIRGDLRRKYGLAPVDRISELEPYLAAIKKHQPDLTPINLGNGYDIGQPFFAMLMESVPPIAVPFFGTIYGNSEDPAHSLVNLLDPAWKPAYLRVATVMKSWYDKGYLNRAPFANTLLSKQSFALGKSAVGFGNSQDIQEVLAVAQARGFDPEIIPILSSNGHSNADSYTGNGVALASGRKNLEKTLQVLDRIMEDPAYARLVSFGVEGIHWVMTPDGKVSIPLGVEPGSNPYPVEAGGFWFVNKDILPPLAGWSPAYLALRERLKVLLVPNTFLGFAFLPTKVRNEVAAITKVMSQYGDVISIGAVANVAKAVAVLEAQLKSAKQEIVLQELKNQLKAHYGSSEHP